MKKLYILLFAFLILTLVTSQGLIGNESYMPQKTKLISTDDSAYNGRIFLSNPYLILQSFLPSIFIKILPILFGLVSLLLIYKLSGDLKNIYAPLLILSPFFIYLFATSNKYSMIIPLLLTGIYLYNKDSYFSIPCFLLLSLFGWFESLVAIGAMLFRKQNTRLLLINSVGMTTISAILLYLLPQSVEPAFITTQLNSFISDFGGKGIGFFKWILAIIGIYIGRKDKNLLFLIFFILSVVLVSHDKIIYLGFIVTYFAAIAFRWLFDRKWNLDLLKYLTIITLISGLLFSTLSYSAYLGEQLPTQEEKLSLELLSHYEKGTVLSHYSNGYIIQYYSGQPVFMDPYLKFNPKINEYYHAYEEILESRDLEKTTSFLTRYNITYIWIENEENGISFVSRNQDYFEILHEGEITLIKFSPNK